MLRPNRSREEMNEFGRRAQEYYDRFLRDNLGAEHKGEYLALDPETGEYEIDPDEITAALRARDRMPDKIFYLLRIGYPPIKMGARSTRGKIEWP